MGKGQLVFKGEKKAKKKSIKKRKRDQEDIESTATTIQSAMGVDSSIIYENSVTNRNDDDIVSSSVAIEGTNTTISNSNNNNIDTTTTPSIIRKGTGKITTSSTVVTGHGTKFQKELAVGDALLVCLDNNNDPDQELRVITMLLSDTSLNLSSAFSTSLKQPQSFKYIRKPKQVQQQQDRQVALKKKVERDREIERSAFDLYSNGSSDNCNTNMLVYREKTETGSYRIQRQQLPEKNNAQHQQQEQQPSRGDLLYLRSKKTSDKYC
jgi:hypothetical protein